MLKNKPNLAAPGVYGVVAMQRLMLRAELLSNITATLDPETMEGLKHHEHFLEPEFDEETPSFIKYDHLFARRVENTCVHDGLLSYTDMSRAADALGITDEQSQAFFTQMINWEVYNSVETHDLFTVDFDLAYFIEKFSVARSEVDLLRMKKVFSEILGNDWYSAKNYRKNAACFSFHEDYAEEAKTVGVFSIPLRNWCALGFESVQEMKYHLFGGEGCCVDLLVSVIKKNSLIIDNIKNDQVDKGVEMLRVVLLEKPSPL
jgi:hypothetical protein